MCISWTRKGMMMIIYYTFMFRVGSEAFKLMVETHRLADTHNVRYLFQELVIPRQLFSKYLN